MSSKTSEICNSNSPANPNLRTRDDWLRAIIHGRQVDRIGQHLALVIYHLTDPSTNTATLSARDLEAITGWSKTVIVKHLREIHDFIHVKWGAGRAKSVFEMQGVIADMMAAKKAERDAAAAAATEVATTDAAKASGNDSGNEVAAPVATTVATNVSGNVAATIVAANQSCGNVVATKSGEGGTIGGETTKTLQPNNTHTPAACEARAPDWLVEDGCFAGQLFELSETEYLGMQRAYGNLEFPAEMVSADAFFAAKFIPMDPRPPRSEQMAALHNYLNTQNRKAGELRRQVMASAAGKPRKSAAPMLGENADHSSCWLDEKGLHLVNGFRAEWLKKFDNDEERLDLALKEIAPHVKPNSPTSMSVQVGGKLAKIVGEKRDRDTRYAKAVKPEKGISRLKEKFLKAGG